MNKDIKINQNYRLNNSISELQDYFDDDIFNQITSDNLLFVIKIFIVIDIDKQEMLKYTNLNISSSVIIRDVIRLAVDKFNILFYNEGISFNLKDDYYMYRLMQAKKNGFPDLDLPCK